ncbi:MAG: hypothetical protein K2I01_00085, partial [Lachnospiraceae bacterium]|nr:hypothetical protein [Lachnospiraceae bacterium]
MRQCHNKQQKAFTQILGYVGRHKRLILPALAAGALCAVCGVAGSELLKRVIDGLGAGTLTDIGSIVLMCIGILTAGAASAWITRYTSGSAATKILQ